MIDYVPGWERIPDLEVLEGAMGTVTFVRKREEPSRTAVVKCNKAERLRTLPRPQHTGEFARLRTETALLRFLNTHAWPYVPLVEGSGEALLPFYETPIPYVVLENLSARLRVVQGDLPNILRLFIGTLQALHRFNRVQGTLKLADRTVTIHGVIHRDIKPDNVWLMPDGRVVAADLGFARIEAGDADDVGTPSYMAPEILDRSRAIGPQADLFSAGAMAYELLLGATPFAGKTVDDVRRRVQAVPHTELLDALRSSTTLCDALGTDAAAFITILGGLIRKDPTVRTASALHALEALDALASVRRLTGVRPTSLPLNPHATSLPTLASQIQCLAAADASPLLLEVLQSTSASADQLTSLWDTGVLRTGHTTVQVDWPALLPDTTRLRSLGGHLAPASEFLRSIDGRIARRDEGRPDSSWLSMDPGGAVLAHELLTVWRLCERPDLTAFPTIRTQLAGIAAAAGDSPTVLELTTDARTDVAVELRFTAAVRLNHESSIIALLPRLPATPGAQLQRIAYHALRGEDQPVLDATANFPTQSSFAQQCEALAWRLRIFLYLFKTLAPDNPRRPLLEKDLLATRARLDAEPYASAPHVPYSLTIALGNIYAYRGDVEEMEQCYERVEPALPPDAHNERMRIAENRYLGYRTRYLRRCRNVPEPPSPAGGVRKPLTTESLFNAMTTNTRLALEESEKLNGVHVLQIALMNRNECLIFDFTRRMAPSLFAGDPELDSKLLQLQALREEVHANNRRYIALSDDAPSAHELTRERDIWLADLTQHLAALYRMDQQHERRVQAHRDRSAENALRKSRDEPLLPPIPEPSVDGLADIRRYRLEIVRMLYGAESGAATELSTADQQVEIQRLTRSARSAQHALQLVLDWALNAFKADRAVIYFAGAGVPLAAAPYSYGRSRTYDVYTELASYADLPSEPPASRTLKALFAQAPEGLIKDSNSPDIIGTESVQLMGADRFLGVRLRNRGVLILTVDSRSALGRGVFGEAQQKLLASLAEPIAAELVTIEQEEILRASTSRTIHRLTTFERGIHAGKNVADTIVNTIGRIREKAGYLEGETDPEIIAIVLKEVFEELPDLHAASIRHRDDELALLTDVHETQRETDYTPSPAAPVARGFLSHLQRDGLSRSHLQPGDLLGYWRELWVRAQRQLSHIRFTYLPRTLPAEPVLVPFSPPTIIVLVENLITNLGDETIFLGRPSPSVRLSSLVLPDVVALRVTDNGKGMDQHVVDRIISGGYSTKPPGKGTGIGFRQNADLVLAMWGAVRVTSKVGRGTTITYIFPRGPHAPGTDDGPTVA